MRCAACHASVALRAGERVGFRAVCERCGEDLHACVQCAHHDAARANACREPAAEPVRDREARNLCEWFAPAADGGGRDASDPERAGARSALDALFKKPPGG